MKENGQRLTDLLDVVKCSNVRVRGVTEGKRDGEKDGQLSASTG